MALLLCLYIRRSADYDTAICEYRAGGVPTKACAFASGLHFDDISQGWR
jgi:hypothetical protein